MISRLMRTSYIRKPPNLKSESLPLKFQPNDIEEKGDPTQTGNHFEGDIRMSYADVRNLNPYLNL